MKLSDIFQAGLKAVGFVEHELTYVAQAGTFIRNLEGSLPPATNPKSLYADVLRALGLGDEKIQQVVSIGNQVAGIGSGIQVLMQADAEFQAGQEVTGNLKIYKTVYDYDFKPRASAPPVKQ